MGETTNLIARRSGQQLLVALWAAAGIITLCGYAFIQAGVRTAGTLFTAGNPMSGEMVLFGGLLLTAGMTGLAVAVVATGVRLGRRA